MFKALVAVLSAALMLLAMPASAKDSAPLLKADLSQIDHGRPGSLTMSYSTDADSTMSGMTVSAYRIADVAPGYPAIEKYASTLAQVGWQQQVEAEDVESRWAGLSDALAGIIARDSVSADFSTIVAEGTASFANIPLGIYLVTTSEFNSAEAIYTFVPSLIAVPNLTANGDLAYDVTAAAKPFKRELPTEPIAYKVVKHWDDAAIRDSRPASVVVDVLSDGKLAETVELSRENNWTYEWKDADGHSWAVVERLTDSRYTFSVERQDATFVLTNTAPPGTPPGTPKLPRTGALGGAWWLPAAVMVLGLCLLAAGNLKSNSVRENRGNRG